MSYKNFCISSVTLKIFPILVSHSPMILYCEFLGTCAVQTLIKYLLSDGCENFSFAMCVSLRYSHPKALVKSGVHVPIKIF